MGFCGVLWGSLWGSRGSLWGSLWPLWAPYGSLWPLRLPALPMVSPWLTALWRPQLSVKNCFIRGSVVRYVQLPADEVDTQLLQDAARKEALQQKQ
uniref:U6 snRNA-associated Sm-like protein LSm2 n=1 Tax=Amazona collaria TaxID=241587 RepID=A0A8B9J0Q5_9PSIT